MITVLEEPYLVIIHDEDQDLLYVEYDNAISYQWYLNGNPIDDANQSNYNLLESGTYFIEINTENGCFGNSNTIDIVLCDDEFEPTLIVSDFTLVSINTDHELEWFWNGLSTGFGPSIYAQVDGYYWFIASYEFGCSYSSDTIFFQSNIIDDIDNDGILNDNDNDIDGDGIINSEDNDVDGDGIPNNVDNDIDGDGVINENDDTISGFLSINELLPSSIKIYPNPSNGLITIDFLDNTYDLNETTFTILDLNGRVIYEKNGLSQMNVLDLSHLSVSKYLLKIKYNNKVNFRDIIIY